MKTAAKFIAAENMDWQQVVLNGGPPCFHVENGKFCGRAERWDGHHLKPLSHRFISFNALLRSVRADSLREAAEIAMRCSGKNVHSLQAQEIRDAILAKVKEIEP